MRVTVVGAGYMGRGIAQALARGGASVTLVDRDLKTAEASYARMLAESHEAEADGLTEEGSADLVRDRTCFVPTVEVGANEAALVIEAVHEDVGLKLDVLAEIERFAPRDAVISTNTSTIPIETLAVALVRPERFFGIHWFNPAPYLPCVEVILGATSDASLLEDVLALLRACGKSPVVVPDSPGFIANRLQFALFKEAALMVEEGTATPERIDEVVRSSFGFRLPFFGPFAIADMAGLDVYASSYRTLHAAFGPRFATPTSLEEKVQDGQLGFKAGGGYLDLAPEEAEHMIRLRDRCYVELAALRSRLERTGGAPRLARGPEQQG